MLGLAVGPAFAASLLTDGDYSRVIKAGILLFLASYLFILVPVLAQRRASASAGAAAAQA
jgi:hypothetical protein